MARLTLEQLPELMDLEEAAAAVEMRPLTLRKAIKRFQAGDAAGLEAFIPRGKDPLRAGPGQGYRITKEALQRWYFGNNEPGGAWDQEREIARRSPMKP